MVVVVRVRLLMERVMVAGAAVQKAEEEEGRDALVSARE